MKWILSHVPVQVTNMETRSRTDSPQHGEGQQESLSRDQHMWLWLMLLHTT